MEPKSLQAFSSKEVLAKHKENCLSINGKQGIQMPKKGSKGQFQDHHRQMPVPFVSQYHLLASTICMKTNNFFQSI